MALRKIISLTEAEVKLLQGLLDAAKGRDLSTSEYHDGLWAHGEDQQAPEVYVAKPLDGTIPGMTLAEAGTGTGTGTSAECDAYDSPGSAECRVYEVVETEGCGYALMQVEEHDELVFNVGTTAINPGYNYIPVYRDKFGRWLTAGGSSVSAVRRYGILRSSLSPGGSCIIEEFEWTSASGTTGTVTYGYKQLCPIGRTYRAFDPAGEYAGIEDEAYVEWEIDTSTNAPSTWDDLDHLGFPLPDGAGEPTESEIATLRRITCIGFVFTSCAGAPVS